MLVHDLLMLAGVALAVLAVILLVVSLAGSRAPVNAARALVLGVVAMVGATFANPGSFSFTDIPAALTRLFTQSGLDKITEVPGTTGESIAVGDKAEDVAQLPDAVTKAADEIVEAADEAAEAVAGAVDDVAKAVTDTATDAAEALAGAADDAAAVGAQAVEGAVEETAPEAAQEVPPAPAVTPPPEVSVVPTEGPALPAPPITN